MLKRYWNLDSETEDEKRHRLEEQENVLILFRAFGIFDVIPLALYSMLFHVTQVN